MAFKQVCTSLLVAVACCSVLSTAQQLSYLRETDQNGFPFQNQGSFTYLNDNGANQVQSVIPLQSGPVNFVNNYGSSQILGGSQIQTISSYPNVISNAGFIGGYGFGSNIINNVNGVNGFSGLSTIQYAPVAQVPFTQILSYPSAQPVAQYVQQPAVIGSPVGYSNTVQTSNSQVSPVAINF